MTTKNCTLTQQELKELLYYNRYTGHFIWKVSRRGRVKVGDIAGNSKINTDGKTYRRIGINNESHCSHRLAWLYVYGVFPKDQIDHINGDGTDNRIENLRDVNNSENGKNQRMPKNNKSGCIGVYWHKLRNKWQAEITDNGKKIYLGIYTDYSHAIQARKKAEKEYGYHANHGMVRCL